MATNSQAPSLRRQMTRHKRTESCTTHEWLDRLLAQVTGSCLKQLPWQLHPHHSRAHPATPSDEAGMLQLLTQSPCTVWKHTPLNASAAAGHGVADGLNCPFCVSQQMPAVLAVHHELLPLLAAVVESCTHIGDDRAHVPKQVDAVAHYCVIHGAVTCYAVGKLDDAWHLSLQVLLRLAYAQQ